MCVLGSGHTHKGDKIVWKYVTNEIIPRLLNNTVLQSEYDEVTRAEQGDGEDELLYGQWIIDAARLSLKVFQNTELVH